MLDRVNDSKDHQIPDREKEALERYSKAQDALEKARAEYASAMMDYGWEVGWNAGFSDGWDAAVEEMTQREAELKAAARMARPRSAPSTAPRATRVPMATGVRPLKAADLVLLFITEYPGARGIDIAKHFAAGPQPIPERTIRTALHRMKKTKDIKNIGGKWYAASERTSADEEKKLF